ncbi:hypothetical protein GGI07_005936, partial [Coemansia sp. Benny D115]
EAVLKLSWTPHDRQPEGAIYDILQRNNISCIPEIYDSGILIKNFFDYRLEYILMEDCGTAVSLWPNQTAYCKLANRGSNEGNNVMSSKHPVNMVVDKVTRCLWQAYSAGVLHRDISAGNIAVNNKGDVFVIDWGYAKPISEKLAPSVKKMLKDNWGIINLDDVLKTESRFDPMTGTFCFMGIRMLSGHGDRSILDDLESLFYVALYMFAQEYSGKEEYELMRLKNNTNEQAALIKVGGLACCRKYPIFFGVSSMIAQNVCKALGPLYNMLFIRNDAFIGAILAEEDDDIRCEPLDPFWSTMKKLYPIDTAEESCAATDTLGNDTAVASPSVVRQAFTFDTPTRGREQQILQMECQTQTSQLVANTGSRLFIRSQDMLAMSASHFGKKPQSMFGAALDTIIELPDTPTRLNLPSLSRSGSLTGLVADDSQPQNMAS